MRRHLQPVLDRRSSGQHAGLILQRYATEPVPNNPGEKRAVIADAIRAAADRSVQALYALAYRRHVDALPPGSVVEEVQTIGRLVVGLGSENVLEAGLRLHHNYGLPLIPGSALKGIASHYCAEMWGQAEPRYAAGGQFHNWIFGSARDPDNNSTDDAGCVVFHDAWWAPGSAAEPLVREVMTPHHTRYNEGKGPPTDFDCPVPVPFIATTGKFLLALSWRGPESEHAAAWTTTARDLLLAALAEWGVGGKTSSGFGRLVSPAAAPPAPPPADGSVEVTVIKPLPGAGKFAFQVKEANGRPGVLNHGVPPATLPEVNATVRVFRESTFAASNPTYRWSRPEAQPAPPKKKGGPPPRR